MSCHLNLGLDIKTNMGCVVFRKVTKRPCPRPLDGHHIYTAGPDSDEYSLFGHSKSAAALGRIATIRNEAYSRVTLVWGFPTTASVVVFLFLFKK